MSPPAYDHNRAVLCAYWILSGISALQLLVLVRFVVWNENLAHKIPLSWNRVATTFNILLFLIPIANVAVYLTCIVKILVNMTQFNLFSLQTVDAAVIVSDMGVSSFMLCYVNYTWYRGKPVFELIMPAIVPYLTVGVNTLAVLFTVFPLPAILQEAGHTDWFSTNGEIWIALFFTIVTVSFDLAVGIIFVRYLRSLYKEHGVIGDERNEIISRYGVASSCVGVLSLVLFSVAIGVADAGTNMALMACVFGSFSVVHLILFLMKLELHKKRDWDLEVSS
ncbi:hypothetical protein BC830DRAFT_1152492 [Chytriomyces sp. MP71]|nr:hypothetical protein BC830DRAFT_1152492 [Chytriomyces sp. MP71]